jgi:hypothetical protein
LGFLLFGRCLVVLHVALLEFYVVAVDCEERWDVGVGSLAVVALVEVVRCDFPVVVCIKLICVIELILIEVELLKSFLFVRACKGVVPWNFGRLFGIKIDPDETL